MKRFPTDDTICNLFRKFGMGEVQRFFEPMTEWQMQRLPLRREGYTLDMDSTVFERYGKQEGSLKGHNPRRHGRPSHHPLLGVLGEARFLLHGWLRSGNCGTARGAALRGHSRADTRIPRQRGAQTDRRARLYDSHLRHQL